MNRLFRTLLGATLTVGLWAVFRPTGFLPQLLLAFVGFGIAYVVFALITPTEPPDRQKLEALLDEGRLAEATLLAEKLQRSAPADSAGWALGARVALRAGDREEAERLVRVALELEPTDSVALAVRDALEQAEVG